ncbi:MAG: RHS repeat-associated core domain-containing protein [Pseudomonadota bacterium]
MRLSALQIAAFDPVSAIPSTTRGFTGHEMIDSVGLVHMNGRVYDPTLGRFLSADPVVQESSNTQNYNRY